MTDKTNLAGGAGDGFNIAMRNIAEKLLVMMLCGLTAGCTPTPTTQPVDYAEVVARDRYEQETASLQEKVNTLSAENRALQSRVEELKKREQALSDRVKELELVAGRQDAQLKSLIEVPRQRDVYRKQAEQFAKEIEALKAEVSRLERIVHSLRTTLAPAGDGVAPAATTQP